MPQPRQSLRGSFAHVYDAVYGGDGPFLRAQLAFFGSVFGPRAETLLDAGCGTGKHLLPLAELGYAVTGVDVDPMMLRAAQAKSPGARLVLGDIRRLPFSRRFDGALCLESPLAYLTEDTDLLAALQSLRVALCPAGKLIVDVYDYLNMLGTRRMRPVEGTFEWGGVQVTVRESHRYEKTTRTWVMRQQFWVREPDASSEFEVVHRLRMRTIDEYAEALERVGFTVLEALKGYPDAPEELRDERRLILVARR